MGDRLLIMAGDSDGGSSAVKPTQASLDLPLGDQLETHSPVAWFAADYLIARRILHDRPST